MCRRLKRPDRSDCLCNNGLACVCCCVLLCPCLLLYVFVDVVGTCDQRDRQRQQCPERNSKVHNVPNDGLTIPTSKNDFRSPPQTNTRRGTIGFDVMCVCVSCTGGLLDKSLHCGLKGPMLVGRAIRPRDKPLDLPSLGLGVTQGNIHQIRAIRMQVTLRKKSLPCKSDL